MDEIINEYTKHIEILEKEFLTSFFPSKRTNFYIYGILLDKLLKIIDKEDKEFKFEFVCIKKKFLFELYTKYKIDFILSKWNNFFELWVEMKQKKIIENKKREREEEFDENVKSQKRFTSYNMFDSTKSFYDKTFITSQSRSKSQSPLPPPLDMNLLNPLISQLPLPPPPPPPPPGIFESFKEQKPLPCIELKSKRDFVYKPPVHNKVTNEFIKKLIETKKYPPLLDFLTEFQDNETTFSEKSSLSNKETNHSDSDSDSDSDSESDSGIEDSESDSESSMPELENIENSSFVPISLPPPPQSTPPLNKLPSENNDGDNCRQQ